MHEKLAKAMKGKEKLSDNEKKAKTSVVEAMRDMAAQAMGDKLHGLKKVTVASPDKAGLEHGLEKAHELVSQMPQHDEEESEDEESPEHEASESPEEEQAEHEEMSPEEIEAKIAELKAKLEEMKKA